MNNWDIGDSEEWIEDVEIENVIDSNEEQILNQQDLIEQIENSSESIKVDFFQEDDGEILSLTEYVNPESNNSLSVIAEYNNIDVINIDKKSQKTAQELVRKITNFIVNFDDVELTEEHQKYLKNVGDLELTTLKDLLTITEYNKQMINNKII